MRPHPRIHACEGLYLVDIDGLQPTLAIILKYEAFFSNRFNACISKKALKGGGARLGLQAKKGGGGRRGSNFGPNVKKPTSWHKGGGVRTPLDPLLGGHIGGLSPPS